MGAYPELTEAGVLTRDAARPDRAAALGRDSSAAGAGVTALISWPHLPWSQREGRSATQL